MTTEPLTRLVRNLKQSLDAAELAALADGELLARFRSTRDPAVLEVIVHRHGPRVLAVCRRVLRDRADADDAFQATFVILLRQSPALRNVRTLGPWLAGVAHRVSLQARRARERRERIEAKAQVRADSTPDLSWRDACAVLHNELDRLPDSYRLPLVLCYLDGLSRDEAANQLGRTLSSVKKSLEKGREVLRKRLARRGITLSAGLLAAVAEPALADLSPSLTRAAVDGVARPSAAVAALARTIGAGSRLSAGAACLAASVLVVGVALGVSGDPKSEPPAKEMPAKKEMAGRDKPAKEPAVLSTVPGVPETFAYGGQVVDRLGFPVKGAKIWLCFPEGGSSPLRQCGESDADGKFAFSIKRLQFPAETFRRPAIQWHTGTVLAVAPDYGVGWEQQRAGGRPETKIQLPHDDVPVEGRVLDLEGKPVAGATVRVIGLYRPKAADLSKWHAELAKTKLSRRLMQEQLVSFDEYGLRHGQLNTVFPPVKSGADGRFTLKGLGRERLALVRIEGDSIETRDVFVMTRPGDTVTAMQWPDEMPQFALPRHTFYGCKFDHAVAPSRPVVGTVRDLDTGTPIAGAQVAVEHVAGNALWDPLRAVAKTDRDGRFKLVGMPLKDGNHVVARGPSDEPYLGLVKQPKVSTGLGPIEVDFALKRGAWVTGRVFDREAKRPVQAEVYYFALADNPNVKLVSEFRRDTEMKSRSDDGTFRLAALPGPGLIAVRIQGDHTFVSGDAESDKLPDVIPARPMDFQPREYLTHVRIDPAPGTRELTCDFGLSSGKTIAGRVVGPDGGPLRNVVIAGESAGDNLRFATSADGQFKARGFRSDSSRYIQAVDPKNKLAGSVLVTGDGEEKGPVELKLQPWGSLTGRLVDDGGEPMAGVRLSFVYGISADDKVRGKVGLAPREAVTTDKEGKFRIDGLVPGMKYELVNIRGLAVRGAVARDVSVKSGEVKDLGEVRLR